MIDITIDRSRLISEVYVNKAPGDLCHACVIGQLLLQLGADEEELINYDNDQLLATVQRLGCTDWWGSSVMSLIVRANDQFIGTTKRFQRGAAETFESAITHSLRSLGFSPTFVGRYRL
jgi:hypothetical protein